MKRSDISPMPKFYDRYITQVDDIELVPGLEATQELFDPYRTELERVQDQRYAPGKWTPKDILQHITDTERVMAYRALRIIRNDSTPLPGFEQDDWAQHTSADHLSIDDLLREFTCVRQASILLFQRSTDEMMQRTAPCSGVELSALALGFVLIGHAYHHLEILKDKYFTL